MCRGNMGFYGDYREATPIMEKEWRIEWKLLLRDYGLGLGIVYPIMKNQVEKNMENERKLGLY